MVCNVMSKNGVDSERVPPLPAAVVSSGTSVLGVGQNCSTQASVGTSMGAAGDVGRVECGKCGAVMTLHTWKKKVGVRTRHGSVSYRSRTMQTWCCGYCDWVLPTTWP